MSQNRRFYVVTGQAAHGVITHRCPTVEFALDSLKRFTREKMENITVFDPEGTALTLKDLEFLGEQPARSERSAIGEPA